MIRALLKLLAASAGVGLYGLVQMFSGGFSRATAASALNFYFGKEEGPVKKPAKVFLALCTTLPTSSSTGATIVEATGATGYKRKEVPVASIKKAEEGATSTIKNSAVIEFANITAGSASVVGWALLDTETAKEGNVLMWGECTTTEISTTQTPPTVAEEKLVGELK